MSFDLVDYTPTDRLALQALWREYAQAIEVDLGFQNFEEEIAGLPGHYIPSQRGGLWLVKQEDRAVGCVALYCKKTEPLTAEIKRLFVQPACQGHGLGRQLLTYAIEQARTMEYKAVWLDSLARLTAANQLYSRLGFEPIEPYNNNPNKDVVYWGLTF